MSRKEVTRWQQPEQARDTLALSGPAPHEKPRVHKVMRTRAGMSLVQTSCGGFAAGKGLRTGAEIPRGVHIYRSMDSALNAYLEDLQ